MFSDEGRVRLAEYATGDVDRPLSGFWTKEEVDGFS
jgi:hypothetical protein